MAGYTRYNNEFFVRSMAMICEELVSKKVSVPEDLVRLDLLGPRHASWGAQQKIVAGQRVVLGVGEALLSIGLLSKIYGWTESKAKRFLRRLVKEGFLVSVRQEGNAGTVYRIDRYQEYRSKEPLAEDLLPPLAPSWVQNIERPKVIGTAVVDDPFVEAYEQQLSIDDRAVDIHQSDDSTMGVVDETSTGTGPATDLGTATTGSRSDSGEIVASDLPPLSQAAWALLEREAAPVRGSEVVEDSLDFATVFLAELERLFPGPIRPHKQADLETRWYSWFPEGSSWTWRCKDIFTGLARYIRYCEAVPRHKLSLDTWLENELYELDWHTDDQWIEDLGPRKRAAAHRAQQQKRRVEGMVKAAYALRGGK
jgi:hypothetical protein